MSWEVCIFNYAGKIDFEDEAFIKSLPVTNFHSIIEDYFPNVKMNGDHHEVYGLDFAFDYFFSKEPSGNAVFSLHGENALLQLARLSKQEGWQIFDMAIGAFVDLDNPGMEGFHAHKEYVRQILSRNKQKTGLWDRIRNFLHLT